MVRSLPNLTANLVPTWLILAPLGANIGSKRPPNGAPQAVQIASGAILAPRGRLRAQPPKMAIIFRQNVPQTMVFHSQNEPGGILHRIQRIHRIRRKRNHRVQNRPWVPHAGGQDYGSLHTNSLKQENWFTLYDWPSLISNRFV